MYCISYDCILFIHHRDSPFDFSFGEIDSMDFKENLKNFVFNFLELYVSVIFFDINILDNLIKCVNGVQIKNLILYILVFLHTSQC